MDVVELLFYATLQALVSGVLNHAVAFVVHCLVYKFSTINEAQKSRIRDLILARGPGRISTTKIVAGRLVPGEGWHIVFSGSWQPAVVVISVVHTQHASSETYDVYSLSSGWLQKALGPLDYASKGSQIRVITYEKVAPYQSDSSLCWQPLPADAPTEDQARACVEIRRHLASARYESCTALLVGPPGCGKSSTPYFLAASLSRAGRNAHVVLGFDPTIKAARLREVLPDEVEGKAVIILVIEEIDKAFEYAEKNAESSTDFNCIAQSKASLNRFLDTLATRRNVITVATTNCSMEDLRRRNLDGYARKGRFSLHLEYGTPVDI